MYDYPGGEGQLSFRRGDRILITAKDASGWWTGELNGVVGTYFIYLSFLLVYFLFPLLLIIVQQATSHLITQKSKCKSFFCLTPLFIFTHAF